MLLGKADEKRLLGDRKLVLLVDLDQTLIHTTNDNIPNNIKVCIYYVFVQFNQCKVLIPYLLRISTIFNSMDLTRLGIIQDLDLEHINFYRLLVSCMNFIFVHLAHEIMLIQ